MKLVNAGWVVPLLLTGVVGCGEATQPSSPALEPSLQASPALPDCTDCVVPTTTFVRRSPQAGPEALEFGADPSRTYALVVQGDGGQATKAEITINGVTVVGRRALQGSAVSTLFVPVQLQTWNRLTVMVLGKVGASIALQIAPVAGGGRIYSVTVAPDNVSVTPGQQIQMVANVTADAGVTYTVTWRTSDATRATVSNTGLVTILANAPAGPVAVQATATASDGATAAGAATLNILASTGSTSP